jgi:hypothetical protein
MPKYSKKDILHQLDHCAGKYTFPMLDNGYVYPIDSRLSAYRDDKRWALIIEVIGFSNRGRGHKGINNGLYIFGNCLNFTPGTNNDNFICFTSDSFDGAAFEQEYEESLNPEVNTILLRGNKIKMPKDIDFYEDQGIELDVPPNVMIWEFLRGTRKEHREHFLATEEEIRERIPEDLPLILRLDDWYHNDLAADENPSEIETFPMIASVLETGNIKLFAPTKKPNNHWSNWPDGGSL